MAYAAGQLDCSAGEFDYSIEADGWRPNTSWAEGGAAMYFEEGAGQALEQAAPQELGVLAVCVALGVSGALGGFAASIRRARTNTILLPWGARRISLGFLGEVGVGVVAALSVLFLDLVVFSGTLSGLGDKQDREVALRLLALGAVAGYAGSRLLDSLSSELTKLTEEVGQLQFEAERSRQRTESLVKARMLIAEDKSNRALPILQALLKRHPQDSDILGDYGRALLNVAAPASAEKSAYDVGRLQESIAVLSEAMALDPSDPDSAYNRACARNLHRRAEGRKSSYTKSMVIEDVERAVARDAECAVTAATDEDLREFWGDAQFKRLIAQQRAKAEGGAKGRQSG